MLASCFDENITQSVPVLFLMISLRAAFLAAFTSFACCSSPLGDKQCHSLRLSVCSSQDEFFLYIFQDYSILAMVPVLYRGWPTFFLHYQPAFSEPSPFVPAVVLIYKYVTLISPLYCLISLCYSYLFLFFPLYARAVFTQLARFPPTALGFPRWGCLTICFSFCCFCSSQ